MLGITATGAEIFAEQIAPVFQRGEKESSLHEATEWVDFANKYISQRHDIGKVQIDEAK